MFKKLLIPVFVIACLSFACAQQPSVVKKATGVKGDVDNSRYFYGKGNKKGGTYTSTQKKEAVKPVKGK